VRSETEQRPHGADDPQATAEARRRRVVGLLSAGVLLSAMIAAIVLVAASGDGGSSTASEGAFGTHYDGLEERRVEAGVPTMSDTGAGGAHIHPRLSIYVRGKEIPLPTNIGIDPARPLALMAGLHTHDSSGVIHVENAADPTVGQFFAIWGVPLSPTEVGPYPAEGSRKVRMWVDGKPSRAFGDLVLQDGQQVLITYGTAKQIPDDLRA
jgi:hypothetical protein